MLSFLRTSVPRTNTASQNPVYYEDGRSSQRFHNPSAAYMVTHTIPPTTAETGPSMFNPPTHFHMYQVEEFRVGSGQAQFWLEGVEHDRSANEIIQIPIGTFHRFKNSSSSEPLIIDFRLDEQVWAMEESFFRNFFGYLDDCRKAKQEPSIFQLLRFLYSVNGPLAVPCPGPKWIGRQVSWLLAFVAGVVVGEWLLGYQASYPEYYQGKKGK